MHDCARLHGYDHFHALALRLAEDAHVLKLAALVKGADILLRHSVGIGRAHFGPHLRQDALAADRLGASVLNFDRFNLHASILGGCDLRRDQEENSREQRQAGAAHGTMEVFHKKVMSRVARSARPGASRISS